MSKLSKIFFIIVSLILLFLSLNIHSKKPTANYRCEIHADKAGYYVYLPAFFLYDFNTEKFPKNIDRTIGDGFDFRKKNPVTHKNVVFTKYSCGVAIMDAPFFLVTHLYCKLLNLDSSGFSIPYHRMRDVSTWFYTMLGLILVFLTLKKKTNLDDKTILIGVALFVFGTNFLYYTVKDAGMSHNYSFFLIALFIYLYTVKFDLKKYWHYCLLGLVMGLLILIRPINSVFLGCIVLWDIQSLGEFKQRFLHPWKHWLSFAVVVLLTLIPQLMYYKYAFGSFVNYSYGNESFIYLMNPQILRVYFGLENGWITNNPLHIFTLAGIFFMVKHKIANAWKLLFLVLGIGLLYSAWWCWGLGCGFGHRGFVEYYALLMMAFVYILNFIFTLPKKSRWVLYSLIGICVMVNLKLTFAYDNCWYGANSWDTQEWFKLMFETGFVK